MHAAVLMMLQQEQTSLQKRGCFTENKIGDNTISCRERVTSSKPRSTIYRVRRSLHAGVGGGEHEQDSTSCKCGGLGGGRCKPGIKFFRFPLQTNKFEVH